MKKLGVISIIAVLLIVIGVVGFVYLRVPSYTTYDNTIDFGGLQGLVISEELQEATEYFVDEQVKFEIIEPANYICSYFVDSSGNFLLIKVPEEASGYRVDIISDVDLTGVSKNVLREILKDSEIVKYSWKY